MSSDLDSIFSQVPLANKAAYDRMTVFLDPERKIAVETATLGITERAVWVLRDKLRYDIWPDQKVVLANLQEQIPNFFTRETLPVDYRVRVWIRREDAKRATVALHHPQKPPETVVRQHIGVYLAEKLEQQSSRSREAMAAHLVALAKDLEKELKESLWKMLGLSCELILQPPDEVENRTRLSFGPLDVRPQDAQRQTGLSVIGDIVLEPADDSEAGEAPPLTEQGWVDLIRRCVEATYLDRITMRDHLYDVEKVKAVLLKGIDNRLRRVGRRVKPNSLQIRARSSEKIPPSESQVAADYEWTSKRWGRKVRFKAEARMTLDAPANWPSGQDRDLDTWFKATIRPAIDTAMHGRDFDSLELEDDIEFRSKVAKIIEPLAAVVGYKLELLLFVSENEPRKALKTFSVLIPPSLDGDWAGYETKRPGVRAKFQIEVRMRLTTLKGHAERFQGNLGFSALMDEVATIAGDAARRHMRSVEAEQYINQWDVWRKDDETGEFLKTSQYQNLRNEIDRDLQKRFAPAQIQIGLYRDLSPLSDFKSRATQIALTPVKVCPAVRDTESDAQEAQYELRYSIADIDPLYVVEVMATGRDRPDKSKIEENLARASEEALRTLKSFELVELNYEDVTVLEKTAFARDLLAQVQRAISPKYAIILRLDGLKRLRSKQEQTGRDEKEIALNFTIAGLASINAAIADIETDARARRQAISRRIEALEDALLRAQTAATLDLDDIEARKRLLYEATQEKLAIEDRVQAAIGRVKGDVSSVGLETPAGFVSWDGGTRGQTRQLDDID